MEITAAIIWGLGATAVYWNLRGQRILPSNDHVKVLAVLWPVAIVGLGVWGLWKLCHLGTKHVVVGTVVSFRNVYDVYRSGQRLLPSKSSPGNSLEPTVWEDDSFDKAAKQEVTKLLEGP